LHFLLTPGGSFFSGENYSAVSNQNSNQTVVQTSPKRAPRNAIGILHGLSILVAEDNEINAKLVESILAQHEADITMAINGKQAVEACQSNNYDLILMDIHMPVINGVEATRQIRKLQNTGKSVPIIALTADAFTEDQLAFLEAGMNDVMIKPVSEETLINKILYLTSNIYMGTSQTAQRPLPKPPVNNRKESDKNRRLAFEMRQALVKELPVFSQSIKQSYEEKNYESLFQHVHKLHGAVSYCDLPEFKTAIHNVEKNLKANRYEAMNTDMQTLFNCIDEALQNS
jgi:two-component system sensor histidine kinase BarA